MRSKFLILLVLLVLNITFTNISGQDDIRIHELHEQTPIFEGLNDTGTFDEGSYVYELYSVIEIKYKADRFNVDGVLILGTGSGLIDDITHENISDYEIPKVRSFRNESFYTFELNITSFTSFYGYAYYGSYENGTAEEFELFDNSNRHQLWINGEMSTPSFSGTNATEAGSNQFGDYYAPLNSVVTINYTAITGNDTVFDLFISAGQNETEVYSQSMVNESMIDIETSVVEVNGINTNQTTYSFNLTMTNSIMYFSAYSIYGWEKGLSRTGITHQITDGTFFNVTFSESLTQYTDTEDIEFDITSFNESDYNALFYKYRTYENLTTDTPSDWLGGEINMIANSTETISVNGNDTLKKYYNGSITAAFEVDQKVEIQFILKSASMYYVNQTYFINIHRAAPQISIQTLNNSYVNTSEIVIVFSTSTFKGTVSSVRYSSNLTALSENLVSRPNFTVSFLNEDEQIVNGTHIIELNVTNNKGVSNITLFFVYVDTNPPVAELNFVNVVNGQSNSGFVQVTFDFSDNTMDYDYGVKFATLSWGNGLVANVTNRTSAAFEYHFNGTYEIKLTVYDRGGNYVEIVLTIEVLIYSGETQSNRNTPLSITPILSAILILTVATKLKKKNKK